MSNYPNQREAEALLELHQKMQQVSMAGCNDSPTAEIQRELIAKLAVRYVQVFDNPTTSPWQVKRKSNRLVVEWRKGWKQS